MKYKIKIRKCLLIKNIHLGILFLHSFSYYKNEGRTNNTRSTILTSPLWFLKKPTNLSLWNIVCHFCDFAHFYPFSPLCNNTTQLMRTVLLVLLVLSLFLYYEKPCKNRISEYSKIKVRHFHIIYHILQTNLLVT